MIRPSFRYAALLAMAGTLAFTPAAAAVVGPAWTRVHVSEHWVREAPPGAEAMAAYMVVHNGSKETLELVGATSPQFREVQIHEIVTVQGMTKMQQVPKLSLPADAVLRFQPGSTHLMLMGPKKPLKAGDPVEIVLRWGKNGKTTVKTAVRPRDAKPQGHDHGGHDHGGHDHH